MKVWVTRTQPGAAATAGKLTALGHEPLVAPLLTVRNLDPDFDLGGVSALAFTSANAVRPIGTGLPAFAVGEATAAAVRAAGYADVRVGPSDVAALGAMIAGALPKGAVVLHACAAERAGDLEGPLAAAGIRLRAVPVYETMPVAPDAAVLDALTAAQTVLLHSPKAARALKSVASSQTLAASRVLCLSPAVAAALEGGNFPGIAVAPLPNDTSLLNLL